MALYGYLTGFFVTGNLLIADSTGSAGESHSDRVLSLSAASKQTRDGQAKTLAPVCQTLMPNDLRRGPAALFWFASKSVSS
jgi:hypothetical protein